MPVAMSWISVEQRGWAPKRKKGRNQDGEVRMGINAAKTTGTKPTKQRHYSKSLRYKIQGFLLGCNGFLFFRLILSGGYFSRAVMSLTPASWNPGVMMLDRGSTAFVTQRFSFWKSRQRSPAWRDEPKNGSIGGYRLFEDKMIRHQFRSNFDRIMIRFDVLPTRVIL